MKRILVYDRMGAPLGEIAPGDVFAATLRETINGEHSLEITTTQVLEKGTRLLHQDGRGIWREFAVSGIDAEHAAGTRVVGDYYCPWSLQEDLMGVTVSVMPGVQTPTTAALALTSLLSTQSRWTRGTVTNTATGGASMYDRSAWEALSTLVNVWGGEVDVTIGVSTLTGVVTRAVDLYSKQGDQTAKRRFDFGADVTGVTRTLPDEPLYCRISPRGKGEETDAGGYGRKITIESVNGGLDYLEYAPMVDVAKIPNGSSGYIYPTKIIENSKMETPTDLKAWAESVLESECTPKVSYSIDVLQSDEAGTSVQGVSLGDAVQVVDTKFGSAGLRVEARVVSMTTDLVAERVTNVELGHVDEGIAEKFASVGTSIAAVSNTLTTMSTAQYVDELVDRLNAEINATGGYTYIVPGQGIVTYDTAVSDPSVGSEASAVVEIKGGTVRIANSRTAGGAWDWKTVFTSGHIAADMVTAARITAGYIGSAGGTFIDLDNDIVNLGDPGVTQMVIDSTGFGFYYGANHSLLAGFKLLSASQAYYTFGTRSGNFGNDSVALGNNVEASGDYSLAFGINSVASGNASLSGGGTASGSGAFAMSGTASGTGSVAFGNSPTASGDYSMAMGERCTASARSSFAGGVESKAASPYSLSFGQGVETGRNHQTVFGAYNVVSTSYAMIVGWGSSSERKNIMFLTTGGSMTIAGTLTQNSDRRLKEHITYLRDDACEFVRELKPALFAKDGRRQLGFYAQDVQAADTWDTATVEAHDMDESLGYEPLTLDYSALIAPLTAYAQQLEKRIDALETRIETLETERGE